MALINCGECAAQISDKAAACPHCGNPLSTTGGVDRPADMAVAPPKKATATNREAWGLFAAVVIVALALCFWHLAFPDTDSNVASPPVTSDNAVKADEATAAPQQSAEPPLPVTAAVLYDAYKANEVTADNIYKGHVLAVSGVVTSIQKDFSGDPYVTLAANTEYETVSAYFSKAQLDSLSKVEKGQQVTVTCRGNGMFAGIPILDCK